MQRIALLFAAALTVRAAVIEGVVLERASGRPLARSTVRLEPVPQSGAKQPQAAAVRAGRAGQFTFSGVAAGLYLLTASRDDYFPGAFGQRLPMGRGTPMRIAADSKVFAELHLRRKARSAAVCWMKTEWLPAAFP